MNVFIVVSMMGSRAPTEPKRRFVNLEKAILEFVPSLFAKLLAVTVYPFLSQEAVNFSSMIKISSMGQRCRLSSILTQMVSEPDVRLEQGTRSFGHSTLI